MDNSYHIPICTLNHLARELVSCANMLLDVSSFEKMHKNRIAMARFPYPEEGIYHNDDGNFDASVRNNEIQEMNKKVKNEIRYDNIPLADYHQVLVNLKELFKKSIFLMDEIPNENNRNKHKNDAYTSKLYGIVTTINGTTYKIHFTVLFPIGKESKNHQPTAKIKLYHFTMKEI